MHHNNGVTDVNVFDTPKGTIHLSFDYGEKIESVFEIELSPEEASELISDLKRSLNQLATGILRLAKES